MIGGGEGAVNDTLETTSGDTVTLTCSLDQVDNDPVTFTWARQDGRPLPEGSTQADGEKGRRELVRYRLWKGVWVCLCHVVLFMTH